MRTGLNGVSCYGIQVPDDSTARMSLVRVPDLRFLFCQGRDIKLKVNQDVV